ncbi:MAG: hypothetical protein WA957_01235 [Alteraurantiacibacter sp.]
MGKLNPAFVARHSIVLLDGDSDEITVAMANPADRAALAGLRFAMARSIRAVPLATAGQTKLDEVLELGEFEVVVQGEPQPCEGSDASSSSTLSLTAIFDTWLQGERRNALGIAPLIAMLESGHSLAEASDALLRGSAGSTLPTATHHVATALLRGQPLDQALRTTRQIPRWFGFAVASVPAADQQIAAAICLFHQEEHAAGRHDRTRMALVEHLALWFAICGIWTLVSGLGVALVALLGAWFAFRLGKLTKRAATSDLVRYRILELIAALTSLQVAPRQAVRVGFTCLAAWSPTWGKLPDTREGLAEALELPAFERALLHGNLDEASMRVARECEKRADMALHRHRWLARCSAFTLGGAALLIGALL